MCRLLRTPRWFLVPGLAPWAHRNHLNHRNHLSLSQYITVPIPRILPTLWWIKFLECFESHRNHRLLSRVPPQPRWLLGSLVLESHRNHWLLSRYRSCRPTVPRKPEVDGRFLPSEGGFRLSLKLTPDSQGTGASFGPSALS